MGVTYYVDDVNAANDTGVGSEIDPHNKLEILITSKEFLLIEVGRCRSFLLELERMCSDDHLLS